MSIDGSDASLHFGGPQRVDPLRRVQRDAPTSQYDDRNPRDKRERKPSPPPSAAEVPHDIVDVSPAPAAGVDAASSPTLRPTAVEHDPDRHIDIAV